MKNRFPVFQRTAPLLLVLILGGCTDDDLEEPTAMPSRPVTVIELQARDLARESALTGSVSPYREERIGFEVSGRVLATPDEGLEVRGPSFDERGELVRAGDVVATVEGT